MSDAALHCSFSLFTPFTGFQRCEELVCSFSPNPFSKFQTCTAVIQDPHPWLVKLQEQWAVAVLWGKEVFDRCLPDEQWPPSAEDVVNYAPQALIVIIVVVLLMSGSMMVEKLSEEEETAKTEALARRKEVLNELSEALEGEDFTSEALGLVELHTFEQRYGELSEMDKTAPELDRALASGLKLAQKSLRIAIAKTASEKDAEYADGRKLDRIVQCSRHLQQMQHRLPKVHAPTRADRKALESEVQAALLLRKRQQRAGVWKAARMMLNDKRALCWVAFETAISVVKSALSATTLIYRAELLESFAAEDFSWSSFSVTAGAMMYIELLCTVLGLLISNVKMRGEAAIGQRVRKDFFDALVKKEQSWWAKKKGRDAWGPIMECFEMGRHCSEFLAVPQEVIKALTQALTHATLVCAKSSEMLWILVAISWGSSLITRGFRWAERQMQMRATAGIVQPSSDDYTWIYALQPEYSALFQSFSREQAEVKSFSRYLESETRTTKRKALVTALAQPVGEVLRQASSLAQLSTSGRLVRQGKLGLGEAEAMQRAAGTIQHDVGDMYQTYMDVQSKASGLAKAWDLMTIRPSIDPDDGLDPASRTSGHIVFENVEFAYPEREVPVLRGASFEAKPGQVVGLIGTTGCGKSTALKLLERFYDVGGGRILLDGKDIREYKSSWLRLQIATVAQEPKLLPLTIRDNLAFGCPTEPTTKQIMDACATANIAELLADKDKFPEGLRTKMSAIQNISGGEKQRLAIARAILADPPILLLDEATSALDEESQEKVQGALNELMKGRTTLVIAHRLSTLKAADKIIAFDQGKVIEEGTHEDLLARPESLYAKLWKKQVGGVKGGAPTPPSAPEQAPSAVLTGGELGETLTGLSTSTKLAMLRARIAEAPSDAPLAEKQAILRIVDALSREEALNATAAEADAALLKMRATNSLRLKKMVKTAIFDQKAMRERAARPAAFAAGAGLARQVSMPMKLAAETSVDPGEEMGSADDQGLLMPRRIRTTAN